MGQKLEERWIFLVNQSKTLKMVKEKMISMDGLEYGEISGESGTPLRAWRQLISFLGRLLPLKLCMNQDKLRFLNVLDKKIIRSENI